jgi:hypothetical protein
VKIALKDCTLRGTRMSAFTSWSGLNKVDATGVVTVLSCNGMVASIPCGRHQALGKLSPKSRLVRSPPSNFALISCAAHDHDRIGLSEEDATYEVRPWHDPMSPIGGTQWSLV